MFKALIGSKAFDVDRGADLLHGAGLKMELMGDYSGAIEMLDEAYSRVESSGNLDGTVQAARILRDKGFTVLRHAIDAGSNSNLETAKQLIDGAAGLTGQYTVRLQPKHPSDSLTNIGEAKIAALFAENGATTSLLGRIATVGQIVFGTEMGDKATAFYKKAHDDLSRGSNVYYFVSNAMVTARQALIDNDSEASALWRGWATTGLIAKGRRDPGNLLSAVKTYGSRQRHLRSHDAAVKSVRSHP